MLGDPVLDGLVVIGEERFFFLKERLSNLDQFVNDVPSLVQTAINSIPAKGNITGKDILLLQGVVSMLRDPPSMLQHSQRLIEGYSPQDVMNELLANDVFTVCQQSAIPEEVPFVPVPQNHSVNIPNIGLW